MVYGGVFEGSVVAGSARQYQYLIQTEAPPDKTTSILLSASSAALENSVAGVDRAQKGFTITLCLNSSALDALSLLYLNRTGKAYSLF